jgi:hypothetical protein
VAQSGRSQNQWFDCDPYSAIARFQKAEPCRWFAGIPDMQLHKGRLDGEVGLSLWVLL